MRYHTRLLMSVLLVALAAGGCANKKKQDPTAKEQWNATRAAVLYGLARDQYQAGNFDKSRKTINEALVLDPKNSQLRVLSAKLAIEKGQLELAASELKEARNDPKNAEAEYLSGVVYQRWQQPDLAYTHYSAAYEKSPNELPYLLAKAETLVEMDREDEALALLQDKVVYFENSAVIRDAVGQLLIQKGEYREAAAMLRRASILAEDDLTIREHLATALFHNRQYREATNELTRLMMNPTLAERADLLVMLGECHMHQKRYRDARDTFEKAALKNATPENWMALAKAALQLNDQRRADLSLRKAMSLDPGNADVHLLTGYLRLQQDDMTAALASFKKASALNPTDTVSLCMIGYVLERTGKSEDAIRYYGKALKIQPQDDLATRLLAGADVN